MIDYFFFAKLARTPSSVTIARLSPPHKSQLTVNHS